MERQTITVDIAPGNNQIQRLKSSQGDIGRPLGVYITQNGVALDCSAYTADLYILKPDGNYFTATVTVDATEHNLITWETAKQETPVAGDCAAQIRILSNGDDVGTARFVEYVEASPGFVGESSESVVESLMEYVRQAATSAETASGAASSASGSASAASGSASSAASSASAAAGSASTAHTDAETASQAAQTAQDVAASIPEDYSTLSEDVTGLKSALSKLYDGKALFEGEWKIGAIIATVGQEIAFNLAFTDRVGLVTTQSFGYDITVYSKTGYITYILKIDNDNIVLSTTTIASGGSAVITAGTKFWIGVEKSTPETIGNKINEYINAVTHTLQTELLYGEVEEEKTKIGYNVNAIENLFDGNQYHTGFVVGSINNDGTLNPAGTNIISSSNWFEPKYPLLIKLLDSDYSCRLYFNDSGVISFTTIDTNGNLLYPGRKTKISLWKTNVGTAIDVNNAKRKLAIQTIDDYLANKSKMELDKINAGYDLFDGFVRRGNLGNGVYVDYVNYRCATPYVIRFTRDIRVTSLTGFRFAVHTFDNNDSFDADLGWKTDYTISANQGFKLIIARSTDNTSEIADPNEFIQKLNVSSIYATKDEIGNLSLSMLDRGFLQTGGKPHLAAHMGYHVTYPANSNPAFIDAGENKFWAIESDVNQTSDGHFVMIHDTTVDATTDGAGNVADMTLEQIRALHLTGTELQVPTLEEYLGICKRYSCVPMIELKSTVTAAGIISIVGILKTFGLDKMCLFIGSKWSIENVRAATQNIPYLSIYQSGFSPDFDTELAYNKAYSNSGMAWDFDNSSSVDLTKAKKLHDEGMLFGTFTVDDPDDVMTAFAAGVDFVTTNTVLPTGNS